VSASAQERALEVWVARGLRCIGEIAIDRLADGLFLLSHRDDVGHVELALYDNPESAIELARYDDAEKYRPLKTAPTLRHGWKLAVRNVGDVCLALEHFYPGRLAAFFAFEAEALVTTPLRETLERQSGMYRIAAQIGEEQTDELVGNFCRSDGGCLRTILWRRDRTGTVPSSRLPAEKFNPAFDQTGRAQPVVPLLCQEACNLLVAAARTVVQSGR
jgi:sirohydrochlorin cobaltochelatase